jgi:hypothetical protein
MEIMQLPPRADRRKLIATRDVYFFAFTQESLLDCSHFHLNYKSCYHGAINRVVLLKYVMQFHFFDTRPSEREETGVFFKLLSLCLSSCESDYLLVSSQRATLSNVT